MKSPIFTEDHFRALFDFETHADCPLFIDIFGRLGEHLWDKFEVECNHKVLSFYRSLDPDNLKKLIDYLNEA